MSYCTIKTCYCTFTYRDNSADEVESEDDLPKTTSRKHSTSQRTHAKYVLSLLMRAHEFSFYLPTAVGICVKFKFLMYQHCTNCRVAIFWLFVFMFLTIPAFPKDGVSLFFHQSTKYWPRWHSSLLGSPCSCQGLTKHVLLKVI